MLINQEQWNKNSMSRCMFIAWVPIRGHLSGCVGMGDCTALCCSERWAGEHRCDFEIFLWVKCFFSPYCWWSEHLSGLIFTSYLFELTHHSGKRLRWRTIVSSDLLLLSVLGCLCRQLQGLINKWCSFKCQQMPAVLCWFQFPGDPGPPSRLSPPSPLNVCVK